MLTGNGYDELVVARLLEFWGRDTPWQRRLWTIGTVAGIEEVLEASLAVEGSVLSTKALARLQDDVRRFVGNDPGVGDLPTRRSLGRLLDPRSDLSAHRVRWHSLTQLLSSIKTGYLGRWAQAVAGAECPKAERTARYVAAHLVSLGFSRGYLHRWLTYRAVHRAEGLTLQDILNEAESDLSQREATQFEVVVPCVAAALADASGSGSWRGPAEIARRIEAIQGSRATIRQSGGFVLQIAALDADSAVDQALEEVTRWAARLELATNRTLVAHTHAWVSGEPRPIPATRSRRGVEVGALRREGLVYAPLRDDEVARRIDDALQLLQPLETGPTAAAIGGGWAALEALLISPGEQPRDIAADRLASVVACSYARAELTTLSYIHQRNADDDLATNLAAAGQNLTKARLLANAIERGQHVAPRGPGDIAATARMAELLADPPSTLRTVQHYVGTALRRLYRNRNLILHGGLVSGDGREETLLTVPPLVGAGVDRIVHAYLVEQLHPVELAARAELQLDLAGASAGRHVTELLEP